MRQLLYNYKKNCNKVRSLKERIEYLRAQAEKITPSFSSDGGSYSFDSGSKVENNMIKILELENQLKITEINVKKVNEYLETLKPYQRHIVWMCIIEHMPYRLAAKKENTSVRNVAKIIDKVL